MSIREEMEEFEFNRQYHAARRVGVIPKCAALMIIYFVRDWSKDVQSDWKHPLECILIGHRPSTPMIL